MLKKGSLAILFSILATSLSPTDALRLDGTKRQACTSGDAQAMFEAFQVPIQILRPRGIDQPQLVDSLRQCQYRLFRDGATFTFSEEDVFLGGIAVFYEYAALGLTREEAIADLESLQERVWLAEVLPGGGTGAWVEQPLIRTAYKNINSAVLGLMVWQHRAFITQLPPGEYLSYWEATYQGVPDSSATVRLIITPAGG